MIGSGDNERPFPEENFKLRMIGGDVVRKPPYHQVDLTVAQLALLERRRIAENDVQRQRADDFPAVR